MAGCESDTGVSKGREHLDMALIPKKPNSPVATYIPTIYQLLLPQRGEVYL